jgi:hypothetical protein
MEFRVFNSRRSRRIASAPSHGRSMEQATAAVGVPVREAVAILADELGRLDIGDGFDAAFMPRYVSEPSSLTLPQDHGVRLAWNLVSIWLLAANDLRRKPNLSAAEDWFFDRIGLPGGRFRDQVSQQSREYAERHLLALSLDDEFWELLPYVLEHHGTGSRASVRRDPKTATARDAKRLSGIYYTPGDVADYMVGRCFAGLRLRAGEANCLDPACGTGVFLRACLRAVGKAEADNPDFDRFAYASSRLHGIDISGHALDAAAFVLLRECWSDVKRRGLTPWSAWHRLRMNLAQVDALHVLPPRMSEQPSPVTAQAFQTIAENLESSPGGYVAPQLAAQSPRVGFGLFGAPCLELSRLFPGNERGFQILVGNPPYAALGEREFVELASRFRSLPNGVGGARANLYPLFVEMMWRFTAPAGSAAALVTPLSIAFHTGSQYVNCRRGMSASGGRWQCAFFDREPHALFGEEVKTRNAILFRFEDENTPKRSNAANVESTSLQKWTSRTRHELFESIAFTPLGNIRIEKGIPKLGGDVHAHVFRKFQQAKHRLPTLCRHIKSCRPEFAIGKQTTPRVFVGGTAYNFLNVYRYADLLAGEDSIPLTESAIHCLEFDSETDAEAAFAILSSRIAFWVWHVLGDGFHVPGWLWEQIPFGRESLTDEQFTELAFLGRALWSQLREHRYTSLNGGKLTIGYRSLACHDQRDAIDAVLIDTAGLPRTFLDELQTFVRANAVIDETDHRRRHLSEIFATPSSL